jgi:hypothetical protein
MSLLSWVIWRSRDVGRAASNPLEAAVCVFTELRRVETDKANALAERVDCVPVHDIDA